MSGIIAPTDGILVSPSAVGTGWDGSVVNFAALPSASSATGKRYSVENTTGVIFVNRKEKGLYDSDGVSWTRFSDNAKYLRTTATSGTNTQLLKSDGTTGNSSQETGITIDDSNNITGVVGRCNFIAFVTATGTPVVEESGVIAD